MNAHFVVPRENVLRLGLVEGMKVADLGAGTGHYSRAAAGAVGPSGKVYAIDIQEEVLKHLKLNTHDHHLGTIEMIWGNIEKRGGTTLRDVSVDAVILANTLFQIESRATLLQEILRILKPGGKVLVVDWTGSHGGIGPLPEQVVPQAAAEALFLDAGFNTVTSFEAGPHHYGVIVRRP
jgi:ubiquinone/menaquinone biosynthesis C-methylase UbiE